MLRRGLVLDLSVAFGKSIITSNSSGLEKGEEKGLHIAVQCCDWHPRQHNSNHTLDRSRNIIRLPLLVSSTNRNQTIGSMRLTTFIGTDTMSQRSASEIITIRNWRSKERRTQQRKRGKDIAMEWEVSLVYWDFDRR